MTASFVEHRARSPRRLWMRSNVVLFLDAMYIRTVGVLKLETIARSLFSGRSTLFTTRPAHSSAVAARGRTLGAGAVAVALLLDDPQPPARSVVAKRAAAGTISLITVMGRARGAID